MTLFRPVLSNKVLSTISFCLFSAWLLAFPFEGQVLQALAENTEIEGFQFTLRSLIAHFIGLFSSGFFIRKQVSAKLTMIIAIVVCIAGSLIFFLPYSVLWSVSITAMAYFAGLVVASWGFYYRNYSPPEDRLKTAADVLIYSNVLMVFINVLTVHTSGYISLGILILFLFASMLMIFRLEDSPNEKKSNKPRPTELLERGSAIFQPLVFLCVFIVVITINSGLMYQVVTPAYAHYEFLTSYYWAVPYIVSLVILRNISGKLNRAYILYIAMTLIGLSFVSFMWLDRSVTSYFIVDTLMLGAFGVCDLFWWSILGGFLDYSDNPAQIFGIGLSMNVLGILMGGYIGNILISTESHYLTTTLIALLVIFVVLIIFPVLNNQLTRLLKNHVFLVKFAGMEERERDEAILDINNRGQLTEKEREVVKLLLRGYTYQAISENLFISKNTIKYHVKNIYQKLNINNKMELIKIFSEQGTMQ